MLEQCCNNSKQRRNNVATLRIALKVNFKRELTWTETELVGHLNEVQLRPRFRKKSLDLQVASLVGSFKKTNPFLVPLYALMKLFTINGVYIKAFGKLKMA